jgi:hypothetical protein
MTNSLRPSSMFMTDRVLKKNQLQQLKEVLTDMVATKNAAAAMILEAGLKYEKVSFSAKDSELLGRRRRRQLHRVRALDMSRRATFREADVSRALKGARKAGLAVARIEIDREGKIVLVAGAPAPGDGKGRKTNGTAF